MSASEVSTPAALDEAPDALRGLYERVTARLGSGVGIAALDDSAVQDLLALACKLFAERRQERPFDAFGAAQAEAGLTATDGAVAASAILDAVSVEVFELGMWRTWGTTS